MAKQALGKGLGALIGRVDKDDKDEDVTASPVNADPEPGDRVISASLSEVIPSPLQPRKHFTDDALDELVDSIREHGVIQPLIVRRVGDKLELIAGERRWRACQKVGVATVPVIEREASDRDVLEMALIENLQREDLNPIEEADAYVRLAKDFGMTQEEIAGRVGKNRATVANSMRLLDLSVEAREHLIGGRISIGHAKVILAVKLQEEQTLIAGQVVKRGLTVRATEKLVNEHLNPEAEKGKVVKPGRTNQLSAALTEVQEQLRERLATQVQIHHGAKKGRIEIEYYSNEDLERLLELMGVS
ncbi:MAG: ParB/RepB/Spo0J family partition protein [Verrucomicrobiaceae bacterium]|nr:ParB/RepB/Spo0J family partition protein [Verrucomicrobiaceae bacterium]